MPAWINYQLTNNKGMTMQSRRCLRTAALAAVLTSVGLTVGCGLQQHAIVQHEDALAAAGFTVRLANTPARQAMLHRLPPNQFVRRVKGDTIHYVYADPLVCSCLYIGTQQAYDQYRSDRLQQQLVNEQQMAAQTYEDATWNWDAWGPWGPGYGPYGFVYGPVVGW